MPTVAQAREELLAELRRLGASGVEISTAIPPRNDGLPRAGAAEPADPGVAVYFELEEDDFVLACDRWYRVAANMRAIAKHVAAIRGIARWGVGRLEQAFRGYQALPEKAGGLAWWEVLGFETVAEAAPLPAVKRRFAKLYAAAEVAGKDSRKIELTNAFSMAKQILTAGGAA